MCFHRDALTNLNIFASYVIFLPERDSMGRKVVFYRPGVADPMAATIGYDVLTLNTVLFDMLLDDEEDQIRGVVHIADAKGVRMPHFTVFTPQHSFRIGKNTEVIKSKRDSN